MTLDRRQFLAEAAAVVAASSLPGVAGATATGAVRHALQPGNDAGTTGTMHRIDREWSGTTTVLVRLPMQPLITTRYNGAVATERGPLVYSLRVSERWTRVNADKPHRELPHGDFEVRPGSPWNYGLVVDPQRASERVRFVEQPVGERPFSPEGAGVMATVTARRLPRWTIESGWAGEISPVDTAWADPRRLPTTEPVDEVTLIPYGCTNIRITEFPRVTDTV